jgi:hypothetical protein
MAYNILENARTPLHITDLLAQIQAVYGIRVDRESLVSSIVKKIGQGKCFLRTERNTFALRTEEHA